MRTRRHSGSNFVPLGDQAWLVYWPTEAAAIAFASAVRDANFAWLVDVVPAYASVGVHFNADMVRSQDAQQQLASLSPSNQQVVGGRKHQVPCCYEMQKDLARVAEHTKLSSEQVIKLHTAHEYTIYAVGFAPGFPYLGYLPKQLTGVPRLASPRLRVEPGSVGLTGKQTGIYPQVRPGGWNLIGRTPLTLVDIEDGYFPLRVGDRMQFMRIDEAEFRRLEGERLP